MNDLSKQQLSALLDGELGHDELRFVLRHVGEDTELASLWSRYHLIGESLRGERVPPVTNFSIRVQRVIASESPAKATTHRPHRWLRYGLGGGIAASVAMAALVWMQPQGALPAAAPVASDQAVTRPATPLVADISPGEASLAASRSDANNVSAALLMHAGDDYLNVQPAAAVRNIPGPVVVPQARQQPVWLQSRAPVMRYHGMPLIIAVRAGEPVPRANAHWQQPPPRAVAGSPPR